MGHENMEHGGNVLLSKPWPAFGHLVLICHSLINFVPAC